MDELEKVSFCLNEVNLLDMSVIIIQCNMTKFVTDWHWGLLPCLPMPLEFFIYLSTLFDFFLPLPILLFKIVEIETVWFAHNASKSFLCFSSHSSWASNTGFHFLYGKRIRYRMKFFKKISYWSLLQPLLAYLQSWLPKSTHWLYQFS